MTFKIGIDVGGTFTDFLLMEESGEARIFKVLSTPHDPSEAVLAGLNEMASGHEMSLGEFLGRVERIVHGTTVTTNAVLTGKTVKTALLTTEGFRDALEMRRGVRETLYDNKYRGPEPLVPRFLRLPIGERTDADGTVCRPVDHQSVEAAIAALDGDDIEAIAICFLNAHANAANEEEVAARIAERVPDAYLSVSSRVLPQIRFYERVSTAVLNAAVGPILQRYLTALTRKLGEAGFGGILLIMQSNGGVGDPRSVAALAASTLLSGPAAAPIAGLAYMRGHGVRDFITMDMGGTSFDAALVTNGEPEVTTHGQVERMAMALPSMEIITVGAGGGSIAWIDEGGLLRMGPQSAGAAPGPVCYGRGGTEPTCSDANLVLGYLNPDFFAGGRMPLDLTAARQAIAGRVGDRLGLEPEAAAAGMFHIMNVNMASAIREISVQKGFDPREFPLICAGGAGAIHAASIAREMGITKIFVPREASIFCAAGMLRSDLKHDFVRSHTTPLDPRTDSATVIGHLDAMIAEGRAQLAREGVDAADCRFRVQMDLRYAGQYHEVTIEVPDAAVRDGDWPTVRGLFHAAHDRMFGYELEAEGTSVELVSIRVTASGETEKPALAPEPDAGADAKHALKNRRAIYLPSAKVFQDVNVYDGDRLRHGNALAGPAIIEAVNTTIFVPDDFHVVVDPYGTIVMTAK